MLELELPAGCVVWILGALTPNFLATHLLSERGPRSRDAFYHRHASGKVGTCVLPIWGGHDRYSPSLGSIKF